MAINKNLIFILQIIIESIDSEIAVVTIFWQLTISIKFREKITYSTAKSYWSTFFGQVFPQFVA